MITARICPQCQQPLSADAPAGLCPQCLMKAASGPPPSAAGDGLAADLIDIADPAEVAKKLPQFEILELLGRGGMGVVYKARQLNLDRIVALKILPPLDAQSPDFVARFTREARALAKLNHPNIVNVYDFGETGGLYWIIMEFVDGANLRQLFQTRKLTSAEALAIVPKICDALQYAHEEGLVHRDIKPENLLIDKKGRVKIADFGLAKLLRREPLDMTLTLSGMALGTLRYMAPEQMDKPETVDHRADLYSLGVVIYEMLTGETPVGRFELPSQKAQVDVRFDEIVLHALEREPDRRYQHASQVRDDVEKVTSTLEANAAATPPPAAPVDQPAQLTPGFSWLRAFGGLLLGWVGVGLLWNLRTPGCVAGALLMSGIFVEIMLRRARRNPHWLAMWRSAGRWPRIQFLFGYMMAATLGFFYLFCAICQQWEASPRNWNPEVVSPAEFEAMHKGKEHQLIRQLDAFKETVPTTELSRHVGSRSWGAQIWTDGSPALDNVSSWSVAFFLLFAAFTWFILAQGFFAAKKVSLGQWNRGGYRPAAALTALVLASALLDFGTLLELRVSEHRGAMVAGPSKRLTLAASVEQVHAAVTQWAHANDYRIGDAPRWSFDTVPKGTEVAKVEITSAWKPSQFDRWQMTLHGWRRISPHLAFQIVGTDQPAQSIVTISSGGTMPKDAPELNVWERELAVAVAALEQAGKSPAVTPATGQATGDRDVPLWLYLCGVVGVSLAWASIRVVSVNSKRPAPLVEGTSEPVTKMNAWNDNEDPSPALLRLGEQFGAVLGPFATAANHRDQIAYNIREDAAARVKAEQMLRDAGSAFAADEKPEELVKKLESIMQGLAEEPAKPPIKP